MQQAMQRISDYYSKPFVKFELIKFLQRRYLSGRKTIPTEKNPIVFRHLTAYTVQLLQQSFERLELFSYPVKLYFDLTVWRQEGTNGNQNAPFFSFKPEERAEQKKVFTDEEGWKKYAIGFDFAMDFDSEPYNKAYEEAKIVKKMFDELRLPFTIGFSVAGNTPILVKIDDKINFLYFQELFEKLQGSQKAEILSFEKEGVTFSAITGFTEHESDTLDVYYECNNQPITLSPDHSTYIFDGKLATIIPKKTNEIKESDFLVTFIKQAKKERFQEVTVKYWNKREMTEKITLTDDLLRLCGYYLGDGSLCVKNGRISFSFGKKEKSTFAEDVKKIVSCLGDTDYFVETEKKIRALMLTRKKPTKIWNEIGKGVSLGFVEGVVYKNHKSINRRFKACYSSPHPSVIDVHFSSKKWCQFLLDNFGKGAFNKRLPSWAWELNKEQFLNLLQGYINSDGSKNKKNPIVIKSVSHDLIKQFCWLCKLNGIGASLHKEISKPHKLPQGNIFKGSIAYCLRLNRIELREKKRTKFRHEISQRLIPTDALRKVYKEFVKKKPIQYGIRQFKKHRFEQSQLNFKKRVCKESLQKIISWIKSWGEFNPEQKKIIENYESLINSELGFLKVKKIVKGKEQKVYDVSVDGTENFWGGEQPILLHNSGARGMHLRIPTEFFPKTLNVLERPNYFKKIAEQIIYEHDLETVDLSVYTILQILKLPYSLNLCDDGKINVVLPLDDSQFEHFNQEIVELEYVLKNVKIFGRGALLRTHGLLESELEKNVEKFLKEFG